jgi:hypothetical protein
MKKAIVASIILMGMLGWCILTAGTPPKFNYPLNAKLSPDGNYIYDSNGLDSAGTPGVWIPLGQPTATPNITVVPYTPTGTPTPTGSYTPTNTVTQTPTNTPTPQGYYSGPITMDSLSAGVTMGPAAFNMKTYSLYIVSNGALTYASPATIRLDTSADGVNWNPNAGGTQNAAVSLASSAVIGTISGSTTEQRYFRVRPAVTPVATGSVILELLANYTNIPAPYRKYFRYAKEYEVNNPYSDGHGYSVYYDSHGRAIRVHSWG